MIVNKKFIKKLADKYGLKLTPKGLPYLVHATKIELEHENTIRKLVDNATDDYIIEFAFNIALDHIKEMENYYDKLAKIEHL